LKASASARIPDFSPPAESAPFAMSGCSTP
jgi:hypothetical protein